ncbi:hypothetical protein DFH06DRAFT_429030 [Mycena polygramma]|nr:hypothetical protein DFH06DRAFT_429030 [Mycena polygramma]
MYFHNAATHCCPRVSSAPNAYWRPFHLSLGNPPSPARTRNWCHELHQGSEPLPRPSRAGTVYFQPPSHGRDETKAYVLSWPPSLSPPSPSSASSSRSNFSSASVYYTPPTSPSCSSATSVFSSPVSSHSSLSSPCDSSDLTDDEDRSPLAHKGRDSPKGWARLRANAPPALLIKKQLAGYDHSYIVESDDEDGLVMLLWEKSSAV